MSTLEELLKYSPHRVRFCALVGVEDVRLEGGEVVGHWTTSLGRSYGPKHGRFSEEFANCRSDASAIVRFTRRYGPLDCKPEPSRTFRFQLDEWNENQRGFRWLWSMAQNGLNGAESLALGMVKDKGFESVVEFAPEGWSLAVRPEDRWIYSNSSLSYQAGSLLRFLFLDLLSCPRERLRKCARPSCENPFFIARDLKQNYCSEPCAAWAQREWKRKWWAKHGKDWAKRRTKARSTRRR